MKFDTKAFQEKLRTGNIIRPGFLEFVRWAQSQDHLIFVYTASERIWANFVISNIEKALHIKLERPIFTRANCSLQGGVYRKNTRHLMPAIIKALKARAPHSQTPPAAQSIRMTIIDNLNTYHAMDQPNLVVCPNYNFMYPENIAASISQKQFQAASAYINAVLEKYIPGYHATNDYWTFQKRLSVAYLHLIADMHQQEATTDNFWGVLTTFMKAHPKHKYAKYINRHVIRK